MNDLLKKLQYADEAHVLALNAPDGFAPTLETWREIANLDLEAERNARYGFIIGFVTRLEEVERIAEILETALEPGNAKLWLCYPKGTSKRYRCEFNRDTGWASLGQAGFETVRQIAIDEDWSGLRFRRTAFVKSLTRDPKRAVSASGKARTQPKTI
jgi:hypothetical protein